MQEVLQSYGIQVLCQEGLSSLPGELGAHLYNLPACWGNAVTDFTIRGAQDVGGIRSVTNLSHTEALGSDRGGPGNT